MSFGTALHSSFWVIVVFCSGFHMLQSFPAPSLANKFLFIMDDHYWVFHQNITRRTEQGLQVLIAVGSPRCPVWAGLHDCALRNRKTQSPFLLAGEHECFTSLFCIPWHNPPLDIWVSWNSSTLWEPGRSYIFFFLWCWLMGNVRKGLKRKLAFPGHSKHRFLVVCKIYQMFSLL